MIFGDPLGINWEFAQMATHMGRHTDVSNCWAFSKTRFLKDFLLYFTIFDYLIICKTFRKSMLLFFIDSRFSRHLFKVCLLLNMRNHCHLTRLQTHYTRITQMQSSAKGRLMKPSIKCKMIITSWFQINKCS